MDVRLATNSDGASLTFSNVLRFADGSGFGTNLVVDSGPFSAALPFYFEAHPLREFVAQLEQMDQTLKGMAQLKPMWEDPYVALTLDRTGHVTVHGLLLQAHQRFEFSFETDQTCLGPLHRAAREWFALAPT